MYRATVLERNRSLYTTLYKSRHWRKKKESIKLDTYRDIHEYLNNPAAYFLHKEHWSMDGG